MLFLAPWSRRPRPPAAACSAALVARLVAGDSAALAELYDREAGPVYRYALALCGNPAWAADATHEAFVAIAARPQACDPAIGTPGAWLAGVARHALAALWREQRRQEPLPDDDEEGACATAQAAATPEDIAVRAADAAAVWVALRRLEPVFREALILVDLQERSYAEAAQIAGVELNTMRTRLHRARRKLAVLLGATSGSPA